MRQRFRTVKKPAKRGTLDPNVVGKAWKEIRALRTYHVLPDDSGPGWVVKKENGMGRKTRFPTKSEAVRFARDIAREGSMALVIHGKDGRIMESARQGIR